MTFQLSWKAKAIDQLLRLPKKSSARIVKKMKWFAMQEDPLAFAKRLTNSDFGTYRFRIGDYRVLCDVEHNTVTILIVLSVKDRKESYRL